MQNISELRKNLKKGDIRDIAAATGMSTRYVTYVLDPEDKRSNDLVISAARLIISNREKVSDKISR